jgi:hypothetical protein
MGGIVAHYAAILAAGQVGRLSATTGHAKF